MDNQIYAITDLQSYVSEIRDAAAKSISDKYEHDNLDNFISLNQVISLVKENSLGYDDENRPLLNEETKEIIFNSTATWIHNVGLAKLAAQDLIECAWSDDYNTMVFWAKEKPKNVKPKSTRKRKDTP